MLTHFINGETVPSINGGSFVLDQASRAAKPIEVTRGDAQDAASAVESAAAALPAWRNISSQERGRALQRVADALRADIDRFAQAESLDTGKPIELSRAEVTGAADYFEFYATLVNLPVGEVLDIEPGLHVHTIREPYGVVGIITPWNLPLNQAARACAPALLAGNTVVLKPAEVTPTTSIMFAELCKHVGLPDGVLNVVLGQGSVVGTAIVEHPTVSKVAFTGSVPVGRTISRVAAERILPLTLELGGKSACVVFEDSDLDLAAKEIVRAFTTNAGQVCSSGTRLLVQESVHDALVGKIVDRVKALREGVDVGPIITQQQFGTVKDYLQVAEDEGATAAVGGSGSAVDEAGCYVAPTVYTNVDNSMRIAQEEVFGPVLAVIKFSSEDEAIALANDSDFGLAGGVFSHDIAQAMRVASAIQAGQIYINSWSTQSVQMPFGGHKLSGYGREKGIEAVNHYSQVKSVSINLGAVTA